MSDETKKTIEQTLGEQLEIDQVDILGELQRQPARFFFWSSQWVKASRAKRKQRLRVKETEARLADVLRKQLTEADPKARITEAIKTEYMYGHPEYLNEEKELIESEFKEEMLEVAKDSFKQRSMALQELARQNREEVIYGSEFKLMEKEYDTRIEDTKRKRQRKEKVEETKEESV